MTEPAAQGPSGVVARNPNPGAARQRILVLGAGGFIGRRVVAALAAGEWATPVAALHRSRPDRIGNVEFLQFDARDASAMKGALRGIEGVVNCVTGDAATILSSGRALFDSCAELQAPPRIVHLSTMMVYGTAAGSVDESAPLLGDWDEYSAAKSALEKLAPARVPVVHLRPGIVYGPASPIWSGQIGNWLRERRLGDLGESGLGYCNLVHVDDVVDAILRALRLPGIEGEAFNLALPPVATWNEYFRGYAAALGTDCVSITPSRLLLERFVLAPPLKLAEILARQLRLRLRLELRPPAPIRPWLLRICRQELRLDAGKAERVLGIDWTPLEQGLRETAAWYAASAGPGRSKVRR